MNPLDTYWLTMILIIAGSIGVGFGLGIKYGIAYGFEQCGEVWREVLDVEAEIGDEINGSFGDDVLNARRLDERRSD